MKIILIAGVGLLVTSCATSMRPAQVNSTLPTLTRSSFVSKQAAEKLVESEKCKYLTRGRNYTAPIGLSVKADLKYGANGIDEWVKIDGGNAYVLVDYKWITVDHLGSTQLHITFDTMQCE